MAQVIVELNGRTYRLRCGDGEEPRLRELSDYIAGRIDDLALQFGQFGDERLLLMVALQLADEMFDLKARGGENPAVATEPPEAEATAAVTGSRPPQPLVPAANQPAETRELLATDGAATEPTDTPILTSPSPALTERLQKLQPAASAARPVASNVQAPARQIPALPDANARSDTPVSEAAGHRPSLEERLAEARSGRINKTATKP